MPSPKPTTDLLTDVTHPGTNAGLVDGMCRYRDSYFNRVLAPEGEILSFASPKESIQRKGDPDAACFLRSGVFIGAVPNKNASARRGIQDKSLPA